MRLVRSLLVCLSILVPRLHASEPPALALQTNDDAERMDVTFEETVRYHNARRDLRDLCRTDFDVLGCTDFPLEQLHCRCIPRDDQWILEAHAVIRSEVHLADRRAYHRVLAHEHMHLVDLEAALREHLGAIVAQRFESAPGCEELARVMSAPSYLRGVMNRLRRASNEKYRCQRPGSTIGAPEKPPVFARAH